MFADRSDQDMACPYFQPVKRLDSGGWDPAPRLPLGDAWSGFCVALASGLSSAGSFEPPESVQRELCNCGYARGRCAYFPDECAADAVRFAQTSQPQSGQAIDPARIVSMRLVYILEKDHAPLAFGEFRETEHGAAVVAQARAFLGRL
jgi:hypothetical protein